MAVKLITTWGSIKDIATIANLSYGGTTNYTAGKAKILVEKLVKLGHTSVLEFGGATFFVKAPIYTARQWMRHRHFSYLEQSGRYTEFDEDRISGNLPADIQQELSGQLDTYYKLLRYYNKEDARQVLGTGFLTNFYVSGNLRSWLHFLQLRLDKKAQKDIRENAEQILRYLNQAFDEIFSEELLKCDLSSTY